MRSGGGAIPLRLSPLQKAGTENLPDMEPVVQLTLTLFLLSTINERIVNLVKLRYSGCRKLWGRAGRFGNLRQKLGDGALELNRSRRLLEVNVFFGIALALALRADLIDMLRHLSDGEARLGWAWYFGNENEGRTWWDWLSIPAGCALTGFFLSMGSKFWHDVLDIVLAIKNLKEQRIGAAKGGTALSGEERYAMLPADEQAAAIAGLIKLAGAQWLTEYSNVRGFGPHTRLREGQSTGQQVIQFRVSRKVDDMQAIARPVPSYFRFGDLLIPTDVVEAPETGVRWANAGRGKKPVACGESISRVDLPNTGTIGLKVYKYVGDVAVPCLLSCFHVLFPHRIPATAAEDREIDITRGKGQIFHTPGNATKLSPQLQLCRELYGKLNDFVDAAVAELLEPDGLALSDTPDIFEYKKHIQDGVTLKYTSAKSGSVYNITWQPYHTEEINFGTHTTPNLRPMQDLIMLDYEVEPGDSGAAVYTSKGAIAGMLIAGNESKSYIIPIQSILNHLNVSLQP